MALAVASPIDDKKTPDISSLPLKKDDTKNSTGKVIDSYTQDGIHATPLHKRDTQHLSSPSVVNDQSSVKNAQQSSTAAPQFKQQVPLINNDRSASSSSNNQKPLSSTYNSNNNKASPNVASPSVSSSQSAINQQKSQLTPPRPLSQSNIQPNLASSSRVRRDDPRITDQKTLSVNSQQSSTQVKTPQVPTTYNSNNKASSSQSALNQQKSRVRRDAPRPTDQKTSSVNSQQSSTQVKTPQVPTQQSKTPTAVPSPVQSSAQGSRVNRDTPKPVDTKSAPQTTSASGQKSSVPSGKAPVHDAKAPASVAAKSPSVDSTRKTRDAPKPVDTKAAPQPASGQKSSASAPTGKAPVYDSKAPASVAAKSPSADLSRKTREAPNPHEQSKIVPTSTSTGSQAAQPSKAITPLNPVAAAKSPSLTPVHKRESPASNLRGDSQQSSSSSSNNQSPQFVHPVPVDHILKQKPASTVPVTV